MTATTIAAPVEEKAKQYVSITQEIWNNRIEAYKTTAKTYREMKNLDPNVVSSLPEIYQTAMQGAKLNAYNDMAAERDYLCRHVKRFFMALSLSDPNNFVSELSVLTLPPTKETASALFARLTED
jgi:hypothetical protein